MKNEECGGGAREREREKRREEKGGLETSFFMLLPKKIKSRPRGKSKLLPSWRVSEAVRETPRP
jgi:hypothetical protein